MTEQGYVKFVISGANLCAEDHEHLAKSLINELNEHHRGIARFAPETAGALGSKGSVFTPEIICSLALGLPSLVMQITQIWLDRQKASLTVSVSGVAEDGSDLQAQMTNELQNQDTDQNDQMTG